MGLVELDVVDQIFQSCWQVATRSMTLAVPSTSTHRGAAKHHRLCEGESKKLDLQVLQVCQGLCRLVKMHSYALPPPGGHSIEISATSAANKSSAPPNGPF